MVFILVKHKHLGYDTFTGLGAGVGVMSDTGDGGFAATNGTVANSRTYCS